MERRARRVAGGATLDAPVFTESTHVGRRKERQIDHAGELRKDRRRRRDARARDRREIAPARDPALGQTQARDALTDDELIGAVGELGARGRRRLLGDRGCRIRRARDRR